MDEIVKIKYNKQKVDRQFVESIAVMLEHKYGRSTKLTELYRIAGMIPKLEKEEGAENTAIEEREDYEVCKEEVKRFKTRMEKRYKDQDDDPKIKIYLDWIDGCPPFEPEQEEEIQENKELIPLVS